jgi:hypothetical protein
MCGFLALEKEGREIEARAVILTSGKSLDFIKVCRVSWPNDPSPNDGGAYAQL